MGIQRIPVGGKMAVSVACGTFKFPAETATEDTTPMVMVGLGTGIAPIRSFCQDKLYKKRLGVKTGPMVVFYGCRREKEELFYKEDWELYKKGRAYRTRWCLPVRRTKTSLRWTKDGGTSRTDHR